MDKFQNFLESIRDINPELVDGIAKAYVLTESRDSSNEGMISNLGNQIGYALRPMNQRTGEGDATKISSYVADIKEDPRHLFKLSPGLIASYPALMKAFLTTKMQGMIPAYVKQFFQGVFDKTVGKGISYGDAIRKILKNNPELKRVFNSFKGMDPSFESLEDTKLSASAQRYMDDMAKLVDEHGYWSEPVKLFSAEMESDGSLTPDDLATIHCTHMNMY